ncbi:hypothetical protein [Falsiroseomonas bella]|uniref:hypothetical protein n=1 Tax=Falsiroseomonas bella TaxID=2184016 RepID=UPI001E333F60|nr:hypothetical protein [Falsiroseomonas bella]
MSTMVTRRAGLIGFGTVIPLPALAQPAQPPFRVTPPGDATPRPTPAERFIGRDDAPGRSASRR